MDVAPAGTPGAAGSALPATAADAPAGLFGLVLNAVPAQGMPVTATAPSMAGAAPQTTLAALTASAGQLPVPAVGAQIMTATPATPGAGGAQADQPATALVPGLPINAPTPGATAPVSTEAGAEAQAIPVDADAAEADEPPAGIVPGLSMSTPANPKASVTTKAVDKIAPGPAAAKAEPDAATAFADTAVQTAAALDGTSATSEPVVKPTKASTAGAKRGETAPGEKDPSKDTIAAAAPGAALPATAPVTTAAAPTPAMRAAVGEKSTKDGDRPLTAAISDHAAAGAEATASNPLGQGAVARAEPADRVFAAHVDHAVHEAAASASAAATPQASVPATPALPRQPQAPVLAGHAPTIARDMGVEIAHRASAGGDELVINLDPAELGKIRVHMAIDDKGAVRAVVAADNASVLDALRRDSADIVRAINDSGLRADMQSFRFDSRGGSADGGPWQGFKGQQDARGGSTPFQTLTPAVDEAGWRPMTRTGRVDLMA